MPATAGGKLRASNSLLLFNVAHHFAYEQSETKTKLEMCNLYVTPYHTQFLRVVLYLTHVSGLDVNCAKYECIIIDVKALFQR
jgi:hypothetical protein